MKKGGFEPPFFVFLGRAGLPGLSHRRHKELNMLFYKVIELGTVTEETIEETLNNWTAKGWNFSGMQFAMRESSRRPAMAFVLFTRHDQDSTHE
jgi:hypothetical protein